MKIWICGRGSYSDYSIMAIYSDEATAQRMTEAYGWDNGPTEYELDPAVPTEAREGLFFYATALYEDGSFHRSPYLTGPSEYLKGGWGECMAWGLKPARRFFANYGWFRNREHAIKVCADKMAAAKASP